MYCVHLLVTVYQYKVVFKPFLSKNIFSYLSIFFLNLVNHYNAANFFEVEYVSTANLPKDTNDFVLEIYYKHVHCAPQTVTRITLTRSSEEGARIAPGNPYIERFFSCKIVLTVLDNYTRKT